MWNLPKGASFLPGISVRKLHKLYNEETKAKPKIRLLCALHRKEGHSIDEIVDFTNMKRRTVHDTLVRFVERGINAKDSIKQTGRPPKLTTSQRRELIDILEKGPPYNPNGLWDSKEVRELIHKKYGIKYSVTHTWELLVAIGYSIQRPRMKHHKAPSKKEIERFKKRLQCWQRDIAQKSSS